MRPGRSVSRASTSRAMGTSSSSYYGRHRRGRLRGAELGPAAAAVADRRRPSGQGPGERVPTRSGATTCGTTMSVRHGASEGAEPRRCSRRRSPSATTTSAPPDWDYPLGLIQMCATSHGEQIRGEAPCRSWMSLAAGDAVREDGGALDGLLAVSREDLPRPEKPHPRTTATVCVLDMTEQRATRKRRPGSSRSCRICMSRRSNAWHRDHDRPPASTSARTSRSTARRTRPARLRFGDRYRRPRCSTSIARRTNWTTFTSRTRASSRRSVP